MGQLCHHLQPFDIRFRLCRLCQLILRRDIPSHQVPPLHDRFPLSAEFERERGHALLGIQLRCFSAEHYAISGAGVAERIRGRECVYVGGRPGDEV